MAEEARWLSLLRHCTSFSLFHAPRLDDVLSPFTISNFIPIELGLSQRATDGFDHGITSIDQASASASELGLHANSDTVPRSPYLLYLPVGKRSCRDACGRSMIETLRLRRRDVGFFLFTIHPKFPSSTVHRIQSKLSTLRTGMAGRRHRMASVLTCLSRPAFVPRRTGARLFKGRRIRMPVSLKAGTPYRGATWGSTAGCKHTTGTDLV